MSNNRAIPYCTVKGFRRAVDLLRNDPPDCVDRASLVDRGLSQHAVYPVLGALRYLALIDEHGRVQPSLQSFLDDADVDGRRRVVESAYASVLPTLELPVEDREEVDVLLIEKHGCAAGVAAFCSTFMLWLAAESGLPVARLERSRRGRPPAYLSQLSDAARERLTGEAAELPAAFDSPETARPADGRAADRSAL